MVGPMATNALCSLSRLLCIVVLIATTCSISAGIIRNDDGNVQSDVDLDTSESIEPKQQQLTITRYPVVLIPGDGGNQLYAKINKKSAPHYFCELKSKDYFLLWLDLEEISPYVIDCFVDNMRLVYNSTSRTSVDSPGVNVSIKNFGDTASVEYLDTTRLSVTSYYADIVNALVKNMNYVRGVQVRGAPLDWRHAPNELGEFYTNLTRLVEEAYYTNNGTRVMLMAHSMGNPVTLYWLNNIVNQAWKDKFVRMFVSLSGVWGGAAKTMRLMSSGDNIDIPVVRPISVREYQRSAPSTAFLMPTDQFWGKDEVLASTPARNYTVNDYQQFFADIGYETGYELRKDTENLVYDLQAPNVELIALYGHNVKTPESFTWSKQKDFPDSPPGVVYGDGDGTVNLRSLHGYQRWIGNQKQPVRFQEFSGVEHVATLKNPDVINTILKLFYQ